MTAVLNGICPNFLRQRLRSLIRSTRQQDDVQPALGVIALQIVPAEFSCSLCMFALISRITVCEHEDLWTFACNASCLVYLKESLASIERLDHSLIKASTAAVFQLYIPLKQRHRDPVLLKFHYIMKIQHTKIDCLLFCQGQVCSSTDLIDHLLCNLQIRTSFTGFHTCHGSTVVYSNYDRLMNTVHSSYTFAEFDVFLLNYGCFNSVCHKKSSFQIFENGILIWLISYQLESIYVNISKETLFLLTYVIITYLSITVR